MTVESIPNPLGRHRAEPATVIRNRVEDDKLIEQLKENFTDRFKGFNKLTDLPQRYMICLYIAEMNPVLTHKIYDPDACADQAYARMVYQQTRDDETTKTFFELVAADVLGGFRMNAILAINEVLTDPTADIRAKVPAAKLLRDYLPGEDTDPKVGDEDYNPDAGSDGLLSLMINSNKRKTRELESPEGHPTSQER